jgi:hypothetical protein
MFPFNIKRKLVLEKEKALVQRYLLHIKRRHLGKQNQEQEYN